MAQKDEEKIVTLMETIHRLLPEIDEILLENAKRDLSRLLQQDKMMVIMVGSPRSGKSDFVTKFVLPHARGIQVVDNDQISGFFTKDSNTYHRGSTRIGLELIGHAIKNRWKKSVLYDSTGRDLARIKSVTDMAREASYNIVIIHVLSPLKDTLKRNNKSSRYVDPNYLKLVWYESQSHMKQIYKMTDPLGYFVIFDSDDAPIGWYRYNGQKVTKEEMMPLLANLIGG